MTKSATPIIELRWYIDGYSKPFLQYRCNNQGWLMVPSYVYSSLSHKPGRTITEGQKVKP